MKAGGRIIFSEVHKLINSNWNREELSAEWELIIVPIYKKCDKKKQIVVLYRHIT
jgi:hypothetical protein